MTRMGACWTVAVLLGVTAQAQEPKPTFEVASVRLAPEHRGRPLSSASPRPPHALSSGRFDATTLRDLIRWAFKPLVPIEGSFRELDDVFVVAAKAAGPVLLARPDDVGPMNEMVQSLLPSVSSYACDGRPAAFPSTYCGARPQSNWGGISNGST